jgi:Ca2+-binding RTX toxin-like protein
MKRRILLGALIGASALAAVPTAANASATCTYDSAKREMRVRYGAADTAATVRNAAGLEFSEAGGFFRNCFSTSGVRATATNTDSVVISAFSGTGASKQTTTIDESNGDFSASNPKLHFTVLTGTGGDRLVVNESSGLDQVGVQDQTGSLAIGPAVDLDMNGTIDIRMTTGFDSVVQVNGNGFSDLLDASKLTVAQAVLVGGSGNDTLKGGSKQDNLDGGIGDDRFFAKDGATDIVAGGTGTDHATLDFNVDRPSSIEQQDF